MVNLQGFLGALAPPFDDCPSPCALTIDDERPRDLPDYCAECEVRAQHEFFEAASRSELSRRFEDGECPQTFEELYAEVARVAMVNSRTNRRTLPRGCDAFTAACVNIFRAEQHRPRRIKDWELSQRRVGGDGK